MHFIFCVSGFSGVGKDEFCRRLVQKHGAIHTGLADPAKRHMADIYGFTREQLFGPSSFRNAGDPRYPKTLTTQLGAKPANREDLLLDASEDHYTNPGKTWWYFDLTPSTNVGNLGMIVVWGVSVMIGSEKLPSKRMGDLCMRVFFEETDPRFFLSPREALQLYCDQMNQLYLCTWVRHGVDTHRKLSDAPGGTVKFTYDRMVGMTPNPFPHIAGKDVITCFSDFRHIHEMEYVMEAEEKFKDFKAILIRVKRPGIEKPPFNHRSEVEQSTIPDGEFHFVVNNDGNIEDLYARVDDIVAMVKAGTA